ncbi:MAG: ATP-dependent DNA helicase RecQ [Bacteroidales bacterium]|nr:ATP-dependent DNA helicase RecQ [Bacteroidales bacterium]
MTIHEALKHYWGYDRFRPQQEEIIASVMAGHDTLALLPTGGGKSLCYQLPAVVCEGVCIVVSPLIALMKDQVMQLRRLGIKAEYLVSGMNRHEVDVVLNNCVWGNLKLLYVSPERLQSRQFLEHFKQMHVSMIAVDEAHCISQWGFDFRPPYRHIADIRQYQPSAPVMALTASATPMVVDDIVAQLAFRPSHQIFVRSFARPNLSYLFYEEEDKMSRLIRMIKGVKGCTIVYVRNRRGTNEVARMLEANGINATFYHAGLDQHERDQRQEMWLKSPQGVMVATNAFGMGIDRGDVRLVVHMDIPSSIEAYYQEAGRAGRDGEESYAVMLYNKGDLDMLDYSLQQSFPTPQQIKNVYRAACNFYQIPVGCGADERFDFDLQQFCRTYGFAPVMAYNAFQFLERDGLCSLPERNDLYSRLYIPLNKEQVYRFQVENHRLGDILTHVLRMYGGLFTDFVDIEEKKIGRHLQLGERAVANALLQMQKLDVVSYRPKATKPQILFMSPRIDVDMLDLSDSEYQQMKEWATKRMEAMKAMVKNDKECRSVQISRYFGEQSSTDCHRCDVCRKKAKGDTKVLEASLRDQIQHLLLEHPMLPIDSFLLHFKNTDESELRNTLRQLMDDGHVRQSDAQQLFWIN